LEIIRAFQFLKHDESLIGSYLATDIRELGILTDALSSDGLPQNILSQGEQGFAYIIFHYPINF